MKCIGLSGEYLKKYSDYIIILVRGMRIATRVILKLSNAQLNSEFWYFYLTSNMSESLL